MQKLLLLLVSLVFILLIEIPSSLARRRKGCGGTYTAARGILTTPNFPDPFEVPIKCQWIIDASNILSQNTSIIVYFTQLFTFEGLTFTEYQLYSNDYKINPKIIHKVNETNIIRTRWIQTYQSFLVIELKLQTVESTQLRVLDRFLDIYGFNITYEITSGNGARNPSCTMTDCGFTGICYDHYSKFSCSCFDGYVGPNCSEGPKSFCYTNGIPICKNGGTCLHVGVAAVKCHCTKLFTGNTCETPMMSSVLVGELAATAGGGGDGGGGGGNVKAVAAAAATCTNCPPNCSYDNRLGNHCECLSARSEISGPPGLFTTLHLGNLPNLDPNNLKFYIKTQLLQHLRRNFSRIEDLQVVSLIHYMSGADVTFQIYTQKKDEKKVKNVLNKWIDRGYVGNITVSEKDNSIKTTLSIQSVDINQPGIIRENDEFILSCVARGSPSMLFRWFKDGVYVNLTYARHKWIKLIKDPHVTDQYTALLAVERAEKYDEGKFTCQVEDFNIQQCMSKFVKVKSRPLVKMEPMSLTVKKGENFTVKCVTLEENSGTGGKYTYSWTKNKELLPVKTEFEKYETLYPAGTILQVFRIEKDIKYSCLVQDSLSSSEKTIHIHVLDREGVHTCPREINYDLIWPETAPDTDYIQECPKNYNDVVTRRCALKDGHKPAWEKPDFSLCTHKQLKEIYEQFQQFKLGYAATSIDNLVRGFWQYLEVLPHGNLWPSEGTRILTLIGEILDFVKKIKLDKDTIENITLIVYKVLDRLCAYPDAFIRSAEIHILHDTLFTQLKIMKNQLKDQIDFKYFNLTLNLFDVTLLKATSKQRTYFIPVLTKKSGPSNWISSNLSFNLKQSKQLEIFSGIIFRNLSAFFPPKLFLRIRDGTEIQYQIYSEILSIQPLYENTTKNLDGFLTIDFQHKPDTNLQINNSNNNSGAANNNNEKWEIKCGYATSAIFAYTWDIYTCHLGKNVGNEMTRCLCPDFGSYVLLRVLAQPDITTTPNDPGKYVLISSFLLCIFLALVTTFCLGISFFCIKRSCLIVLKLQCSFSIFLCEVLFVVAVLIEPPEDYLMVFLTFLEMFLLLGISSHLTKLLIIFTEIITIPKSVTSKYTVSGIISGVPIITIFGNHLAYKTMNINLKSWWMVQNSLSFNIFITVVTIITALFVFLYISVVRKLKDMIAREEKHEKILNQRISLIKRSGFLFFILLTFTASSIIYINNQNLIWSTYQFSAANVLLGVSIIICYVLASETGVYALFRRKTPSNDNFFISDTTGPLEFLTKQEAEIDNQSGTRKQDIQLISLKTVEPIKVNFTKTQSISNAFESCLQTSSNFCDVSGKDNNNPSTLTRRDKNNQHHHHQHQHQHHQIESYNSSPPTFRKLNTNNTFSQSPDILAQKVCVELDLVASSRCASTTTTTNEEEINKQSTPKTEKKNTEHKTVRIMFPPQVIITPDDAISKILEDNPVVELARPQPDGHDNIINITEELKIDDQEPSATSTSTPTSPHHPTVSFKSDNLDGVLDSISHDLDYLLNGNDDVDAILKPSTLTRKVSKPPGASVENKIPEELISKDDSASPEGIMLRTNC